MKRSEMIQKINNFLKGYEDPNFDEEREDDAEALLSLIEHWGMLPPASHLTVTTLQGKKIGEDFRCTWDTETDDV